MSLNVRHEKTARNTGSTNTNWKNIRWPQILNIIMSVFPESILKLKKGYYK